MGKIFTILKNIILFLIKEICSFFIKFTLFIIVILIIITTIAYHSIEPVEYKKEYYVNLDLTSVVKESTSNLYFFNNEEVNFYKLLEILENIKNDEQAKGIIYKANNNFLSTVQINEVGEKLKELESANKKVIAYLDNADNNSLLLASYANEIFMPNTSSSSVDIYPYFNEDYYIKNFIDKIGLEFNVVHIGAYKSYGENLAKHSMSKESREEHERIYEKRYQNFLEDISKNLKQDKNALKEIIENGDLVATNSLELKEKKLITDFTDINRLLNSLNIVELDEYIKNYMSFQPYSDNMIALLNLEGNIVENEMQNNGINHNSVIEQLEELKNDSFVKALVLRVNSPGGSAFASNLIAKKIEEVAKIKPVYVSMGSVAASGGYYISSAANKIFANKNTITGSIGVVSVIQNVSKTLDKLDIKREEISKGKFADLYSMTGTFTKEKYEKIKNSNIKVYEEFKDVVANNRKLDKNYLETIAGGRIYTGEEAKNIGLVDEVGGLEDTIKSIAKDYKLQDYSVKMIYNQKDYKKLLKKYSKFINVGVEETVKNQIKETIKESINENININQSLLNKPITYTPEYLFRKKY